jgi:hypothetical protein
MRLQSLSRWLVHSGGGSAPPATILVRLAVGGVFLASVLIKFLYANQSIPATAIRSSRSPRRQMTGHTRPGHAAKINSRLYLSYIYILLSVC